MPYDRFSSLSDQVITSFHSSLKNLKTDYLDSYILHSPMKNFEDTMIVWRIFEDFVDQGKIRSIGISNTYNIEILKQLYDESRIKPSYLQNRFYKRSHYDIKIRQFCQEKIIKYQSFWTLTANPHILNRYLHLSHLSYVLHLSYHVYILIVHYFKN